MTMFITRRHALIGALAMTAVRPALAESKPPVDVALVLSLDVSSSVVDARWELQRGAYRDAFLDSDIIATLRSGPIGRIAVTVVEWSYCERRIQVVPWTVVSDQVSGANFALALANMPKAFYGKTCVGGGLYESIQLLQSVPFEAMKKVIDISGDGLQNEHGRFAGGQSLEASAVRDLAVASGIVINGLPILLPESDQYHYANVGVEAFYRDHVITPNGFMVVVPNGNDASAFSNALKRKLLMEVA
ncbi:MAG: DUF1194 domain-containing protein [bacterium]|nr:DUF1194 domain-containing protein [bacterium]